MQYPRGQTATHPMAGRAGTTRSMVATVTTDDQHQQCSFIAPSTVEDFHSQIPSRCADLLELWASSLPNNIHNDADVTACGATICDLPIDTLHIIMDFLREAPLGYHFPKQEYYRARDRNAIRTLGIVEAVQYEGETNVLQASANGLPAPCISSAEEHSRLLQEAADRKTNNINGATLSFADPSSDQFVCTENDERKSACASTKVNFETIPIDRNARNSCREDCGLITTFTIQYDGQVADRCVWSVIDDSYLQQAGLPKEHVRRFLRANCEFAQNGTLEVVFGVDFLTADVIHLVKGQKQSGQVCQLGFTDTFDNQTMHHTHSTGFDLSKGYRGEITGLFNPLCDWHAAHGVCEPDRGPQIRSCTWIAFCHISCANCRGLKKKSIKPSTMKTKLPRYCDYPAPPSRAAPCKYPACRAQESCVSECPFRPRRHPQCNGQHMGKVDGHHKCSCTKAKKNSSFNNQIASRFFPSLIFCDVSCTDCPCATRQVSNAVLCPGTYSCDCKKNDCVMFGFCEDCCGTCEHQLIQACGCNGRCQSRCCVQMAKNRKAEGLEPKCHRKCQSCPWRPLKGCTGRGENGDPKAHCQSPECEGLDFCLASCESCRTAYPLPQCRGTSTHSTTGCSNYSLCGGLTFCHRDCTECPDLKKVPQKAPSKFTSSSTPKKKRVFRDI